MPHKLLTVAEFAETLGVSPRTVAREINDGAITVVQVRGSVRIDPADRAAQALHDRRDSLSIQTPTRPIDWF